MENYKIKRNPKPLSDEQINRHKDFDKLLGNQQKLHRYKDATKPLYKNFGFLCLMVLISAVLLVLVLEQTEDKAPVITKDSLAVVKADTGLPLPLDQNQQKSTPLENRDNTIARQTNGRLELEAEKAKAVYETFIIDPAKGGVLYTRSGARILIPAFAFSDKTNKTVKAEVILKYRELTNLTEVRVKTDPSFKSPKVFEFLGMESVSQKGLFLSKPIVVEVVTAISEIPAALYGYSPEREEWVFSNKGINSYRFLIQAEDTQFPELATMKDLVWELPEQIGKPTDFNYIFNHPWKSFSYKTTDKKELSMKNTNSSFTGISDIAPILGDPKQDLSLKEAFYNVYNYANGKNKDSIQQKQAIRTIENWKNSPEGKAYKEWVQEEGMRRQFYKTCKISKFQINNMGINGLSYFKEFPTDLNASNRILQMEKYPAKGQLYNKEMNQY